ncbi:hypothetical protein MOMA_02135 [Moraxella macacae 0408225]|uniref:SCP2 domain-containing protein n=1 Tax=Moraxella macacae 0408225 TaxID=1230338 RepID=L2F9M7_9GAMM|nr:hypothetical protein [Moraxella macacae]ELA09168.1 hypothetical protein MOMA_02135 [Moraxella macacae 0408225]
MFSNVKSDPLDVLLFSIGLRLAQLAKTGDSKFKSLLENRHFSIQIGSEVDQVFRTFTVNNGYFIQVSGKAQDPELTITFKDSMTGLKLLAKGDATALMVGIQNKDVVISGDYSLLMWFNQVAKFIVPPIPEPLKPIVDQAKPLLEKITPIVQDLFGKATAFFDSKTTSDEKTVRGESKYFKVEDVEDSEQAQNDDSTIVDNLKEKAHELKETAENKLEEVKLEAQVKLEEGKEKLNELKETAENKFDEVKLEAEIKLEEGKEKLDELKSTAQEKVANVNERLDAMSGETKEKIANLKKDIANKANTTTNNDEIGSFADFSQHIDEAFDTKPAPHGEVNPDLQLDNKLAEKYSKDFDVKTSK